MLTLRLTHSELPLYRSGSVTIVLSQYSIDRDKDLCLTHECKTLTEVRAEVERLKTELDSILLQAEQRL
jgi:hypothetical protein